MVIFRQVRKLPLIVVLLLAFFFLLTKVNVELTQSGYFIPAIVAKVCALLSFVMLVASTILLVRRTLARANFAVAVLCWILLLPFLFFSVVFYGVVSRIILNTSRPADPASFIKNQHVVQQLSAFSEELIRKGNVLWVGNGRSDFVFEVACEDGNYLFDSTTIPRGADLESCVPAEDTAKVRHLDLPFQLGYQPTDKKFLDPNDYNFCARASSLIRKVGFDNVKLYPGANIVQYQIYDFVGWDNGAYYVYFYSPSGEPPGEFKYEKRLNDDWYYSERPRFR